MRRCPWIAVLAACALGCEAEAPSPEVLEVRAGDDQAARLDEKKPAELEVRVLGPKRRGFLGGKGRRRAAEGVQVSFRILDPSRGAKLASNDTRTDFGGVARTELVLGDELGDVLVEARVEGSEIAPVRFRVAGGIEIRGSGQEGRTKNLLARPVEVFVRDAGGKGVGGLSVDFRVVGCTHGARALTSHALTDAEGRASTEVMLGRKVDRYHVQSSIVDDKVRFRPLDVEATALDPVSIGVMLVGGLAIFIFGMKMMSDSLKLVAGQRLRGILNAATKNRVVGVLTGTAVTGLIQSSSATTVMTVGLVNAGLLTLRQAVSVVLGANIGTTVTAQMIAFKLGALAYPAIAVGVLVNLVARRKAVRYWAGVITGFGLLFAGMALMKDAMRPLGSSHTFISMLSSIDCTPGPGGAIPSTAPFMGVLVGVAMTVLVQSSSATIGLLIAAASSGLVSYWTAFPILLGDNIGTTITAQLAAIGTNTNARRAAMAHTLFNVLGVCYMLLLFFLRVGGQPVFLKLVDALTPGNGFAGENIERHIANMHTIFNVANCLVFTALIRGLVWVSMKLIPAREEEEEYAYLEPRLLDTPTLALQRAAEETVFLAHLARKSVEEAWRSFDAADLRAEKQIEAREDKIDQRRDSITNYLVGLSQRELYELEARQLPLLIHTVNDLERIGDHSINILEHAQQRVQGKLEFSLEATGELREFYGLINDMFGATIKALTTGDQHEAKQVLHIEERVNALFERSRIGHFRRLDEGACTAASGVVFLELIASLEKVGDHLTNIAEATLKSLEWRKRAGMA